MTVHPIFEQVLQILERPALKPVFPSYIAFRVKRAMLREDCGVIRPHHDFPGAEVGEVESLGSNRYAMVVTVANGTRCRITVEPITDKPDTHTPSDGDERRVAEAG